MNQQLLQNHSVHYKTSNNIENILAGLMNTSDLIIYDIFDKISPWASRVKANIFKISNHNRLSKKKSQDEISCLMHWLNNTQPKIINFSNIPTENIDNTVNWVTKAILEKQKREYINKQKPLRLVCDHPELYLTYKTDSFHIFKEIALQGAKFNLFLTILIKLLKDVDEEIYKQCVDLG